VLAREAEVADVVHVRDVLGRVDPVGGKARKGVELLAALAGPLQRFRERAFLPAPPGFVQALEFLLLGADQLVELGPAGAAGAVACRVAGGHQALLGNISGLRPLLESRESAKAASL
jgi:hypothetical protein